MVRVQSQGKGVEVVRESVEIYFSHRDQCGCNVLCSLQTCLFWSRILCYTYCTSLVGVCFGLFNTFGILHAVSSIFTGIFCT